MKAKLVYFIFFASFMIPFFQFIYEDYDTSMQSPSFRFITSDKTAEEYAGIMSKTKSNDINSNAVFGQEKFEYDSESEVYNDTSEYFHENCLVVHRNSRSISRSTFRSRTDSSSIGDYESHSSDYYDQDLEEQEMHSNYSKTDEAIEEEKLSENGLLVAPEDFSDISTIAKTTNGIDVEAPNFRLSVDTNAFDLADFITKDYNAVAVALNDSRLGQAVFSNLSDSDSDSDVIVDVETVDNEFNAIDWNNSSKTYLGEVDESSAIFVDNTDKDPSWNPYNYTIFPPHPTKAQVTSKNRLNQEVSLLSFIFP